MVPQLVVSGHPLVRHRLAQLRAQDTPPAEFRRLVRELALLLFVEAAADLELEDVTVRTPLATCVGQRLRERIGLIPILRAGLGMAEAILDFVPDAQVWHLGLYRDHETHQPVTYYNKMSEPRLDRCYVVDPMLATGGSAIEAIRILKDRGIPRIAFLALIAAPEGVKILHQAHPDVPIRLAALDERLNDRKYILPGLGDAGDRQFGTFDA